ncbi:hypothetical protein [Microseira wollei]|uniref:Uncharacterized protein n=1 Tax=Microseira wollei NIES-4236 TaxID=2530354 RepID=A0AAV3X8I1_9CYAN|nr:hypothetical protein [Microseira wollei]GET38494.1 hypothetical protein MiSe_32520 [Microseira wollei NIES-4236]
MGFFTWLGSQLDRLASEVFNWLRDVTTWLAEKLTAFLKALFTGLQKLWETAIASVLTAAFGFASILYVIFYAGSVLGETIMEIWDPRYVNSKPSQVFKLKQAPQNTPLPKRSEAQTLLIEDWN